MTVVLHPYSPLSRRIYVICRNDWALRVGQCVLLPSCHIETYSPPRCVKASSGKKKIASLASGHTRRSGRFRRNLLNSDADRHGTVRPDAVRHGIYLPDGAWQGIFVLDTRCQGIFLLDAAVSGHFPSGRSRVRAFSFWTQPCQSIFLLDAAVSEQMASG